MNATALIRNTLIIASLNAASARGQIRSTAGKGYVDLPSGTRMSVRLEKRLDSNTTFQGEKFTAVLVKPVYWGRFTVLPRDSAVHGIIAEVKRPKMRVTSASIPLVFDKVETPDGRSIPIAAGIPDDFDPGEALGKGGAFMATHIAKEALNTAVGGWLTPLYFADYARRGVQFIQKDKDIVIPSGTVLVIYLYQPARVSLHT